MAGTGDVLVLQQPGLELDDGKDVGKKKRFTGFKLKNIKNIFTRKKRGKSKEEEEEADDVKARSTTNVTTAGQGDAKGEDSQFPVSGSMSVSHDSVFNPETSRELPSKQQLKSAAISMERLPGNPFTSELSRALRRRQGNSEDEDEALPASPYPFPNTTQSVLENGLKSHPKKYKSVDSQSDHSLMSLDYSDNELEEDFFHEKWASSRSLSKRTASPDPGSGGSDIDLDVVATSQSSLNTAAARHKIAVKPKSQRPRSHISGSRRMRANSPKPVTSNMQVMPELQEETASKPRPVPAQPGKSMDNLGMSPETKVSRSPRSKVKFQEPAPDYDENTNKANVDIIVSDNSSVTAPKPMKSIIASKPPIKPDDFSKPLKQVQKSPPSDAKKEAPTSPFKNVVLRKTSKEAPPPPQADIISDKKEELKDTKPEVKSTNATARDEKQTVTLPVESKSLESKTVEVTSNETSTNTTGYDNVILRKKSGTSQDLSKRKTISSGSGSESEMTVFGELKLKRASLVEPRDWENLEQPAKTKPDTSSSDNSPDNEFSQMFSKFQRRASQKSHKGDKAPELKTVDINVDAKDSAKRQSEISKKPEKKTEESKACESAPSVKKPSPVSLDSSKDVTKGKDSSAVGKKPTAPPAKPTSLPTKPLVSPSSSVKPGSGKTSDVPSTSTSPPKQTVSIPDTSATKSSSAAPQEEPSKSNPFGLKSVGGGGSRPSSVFMSGKSKNTTDISRDKPKTVLVEKSKEEDKANLTDETNKSKSSSSNSSSQSNERKSVIIEKKPITLVDKKPVSSDKKPVNESFTRKSLIIEEKSKAPVNSQQNTNTAQQNNANSERNVTLVLNKTQTPGVGKQSTTSNSNVSEKDENTKPSSESTKPQSNVYKRTSPLPKDRFRSQTLPEQTGTKEVLQQKSDNKDNSKPTPSPNAAQRSKSLRPVSSASTKVPPVKKIEITVKTAAPSETKKSSSTETKAPAVSKTSEPEKPAWARLKKSGSNTAKEETPAEPKPVQPAPQQVKKEEEEKAPSIQDLMKRFQKT